MTPRNRKVVAVAYDGLATFEFGVVVEVFGFPRPEIDPWYTFSVCSVDRGPLRAIGGVQVVANKGLRALSTAGTIAIPGWRDVNERPPESLLMALRRAHRRGARLLSLCSGAFVLAAAGLLDGRRAATHWRHAQQLGRDYPCVRVDPDVLYVDDGQVLTAAGSAAGIDLCLHLVRRDFGAGVANNLARRLVVSPHRDGGQAQFIDRPMGRCSSPDVARLMDWLRRNIHQRHSVAGMAARIHVSQRTLARRFREQAGTTPMRWLTSERVRRAQELLEATSDSMDEIAANCGFGSAQLLRFHFHRIAGTSPMAYRASFRGRQDGVAKQQLSGSGI